MHVCFGVQRGLKKAFVFYAALGYRVYRVLSTFYFYFLHLVMSFYVNYNKLCQCL